MVIPYFHTNFFREISMPFLKRSTPISVSAIIKYLNKMPYLWLLHNYFTLKFRMIYFSSIISGLYGGKYR